LVHRPLKQVLVVDDDPDLLAVVSLALTALGGYAVETCNAPRQAVETARGFGPDLILLDVMMPRLDGFGVLKAMRAEAATTRTPVVFMSALGDRQQIAHHEASDCLGVIAKPFDPVALPDTLEQLWQLHAQRRVEAHRREFETLRSSYIGELAEKMRAMQAAAAALATEGWDRSVLESLSQLSHRIAGSAGLYRLATLSRSAGALEEIVNRLLSGPTWPPPSSPSDLARLVQAVGRTARAEAGGVDSPASSAGGPDPNRSLA
jgi:two-component system OmpR family response regulator